VSVPFDIAFIDPENEAFKVALAPGGGYAVRFTPVP
jgi:hypothetical protein